MPFILRGVNLLGINSVYVAHDRRVRVWNRLANDLKPRHLEDIVTRTVDLDGLGAVFEEHVAGAVTGRTLVKVGDE
jgi:NADPH:quinone reductase-like Zn-dependent oxidoreductase